MNAFATPEWESNTVADKTCNQLFKGPQFSSNRKNKKDKKNKKLEIKTGRVEKTKTKKPKLQNKKKFKNIDHVKQIDFKKSKTKDKESRRSESFKSNPKSKKKQKLKEFSEPKTKVNKSESVQDEVEVKTKKQKPKVTHQTLFCQTSRKRGPKISEKQSLTSSKHPELKERISSKKKLKRLKKKLYKTDQNLLETKEKLEKKQDVLQRTEKPENPSILMWNLKAHSTTEVATKTKIQKYKEKLKNTLQESGAVSTTLSKKQRKALPLRERMLEKLKGARFRYLNEQMYTTVGKDAKKYFESDQGAYEAYHEGYKQQVARWPLNPLDVIIEKIKKLPRTHIIADFGCGEAKLAKSVQQTVHSFDLVAVDETVTACDMAHVPLDDNSVNVVVFCLSLMGTNLKDYLLEARRVLKVGGLLKIAEVESRFESVDGFIKNVQSFGFVKIGKDLSHDLFCFLDFVKKESNGKQKKKLPDISLNPCLYKRR